MHTRCEREDDIAVVRSMHRLHGAGHPVVSPDGHAVCIDLRELRVGKESNERRIRGRRIQRHAKRRALFPGSPPLLHTPRTCEDRAIGIDDISDSIHDRDRNDENIPDAITRHTKPATHGTFQSLPLPDKSSRPGSDPPCVNGGDGVLTRGIAGCRCRTDRCGSDVEVIDDGSGDDGDTGPGGDVADARALRESA